MSPRTFKRRTRAWGIQQRAPNGITNNRALQMRVETLICEGNLSSKEILQVLSLDETPISTDTLRRIRSLLGIRLRIDDQDDQEQQEDEILEILVDQQAIGLVEGYGKGHLWAHLRRHGHVFARDRIFDVWCSLRPDALLRRSTGLQRSRGAYRCPGPNFVWHIDGYMKLELFGIEIYAAVDGYSRYVTWFYVGISTRTGFSVLHQYLNTISTTGFQPRAIRSDYGTETMLIADAHYALRKAGAEAVDGHPELQFTDCFWYGRSTQNQRIESWWGQLTSSTNFVWRELFSWLQERGYYEASKIDKVALLAVYMPSIKDTCAEFVLTWNSHRIRKQKGRPYSVPGKPWLDYYYPGRDEEDIKDYRHHIDPTKLDAIKTDVGSWDTDVYLPTETIHWCRTQLLGMGFDPEKPPARDHGTHPYVNTYLRLRELAVDHTEGGLFPVLSLCEKPTMPPNWAQN
ncbi:hypothetical protein N7532_001640 [Penicillium argentinense]|uniref:Integrase core domain-containing protein n=1 Tax=Penicillium argentinense TaxID=1131581 RepID=A0A9W9KLY4_9EURO|nr:uncharacterized protein N7532_001640 [Penicillium argentinense]KAJ5111105.1 hypothetical protein N7532_001640 [Penicillium argentinense]